MLDIKELRRQLNLIRARHPGLMGHEDEDVFPVWVLMTLASASEQQIVPSLCGGSYDGEMDAIFVDRHAVWIVQGKLRGAPGRDMKPAKAVRDFACIVDRLFEEPTHPDHQSFLKYLERNKKGALEKFRDASTAVRKRGLPVRLIFASTGRFNPSVESDVEKTVSRVSKQASISLLDGREIAQLLKNYIRDVAPAVPSLQLRVVAGDYRPDAMGDSSLRAWTVATTASEVAALLHKGGEQIFSRNIRYGLGDKVHVNRAIRRTLEKEPDRFWFLNNGLTITCESARMEGDQIVMKGAQIINGQQTTRTIAEVLKNGLQRRNAESARVAVRVISFEKVTPQEADRLVTQVVEATNFQNAISKADLRSNDIKQIELARDLQARGYLLIRKRGRQDSPNGLNFLKHRIKREELFSAVAGTLQDSIALREGQTPLFDSDRGIYGQIISMSLDRLIAAWRFWKLVNHVAYGDPFRQGAKFLVHFHAFKALSDGVGRFDRLVKRLENNDKDAEQLLYDIIRAYFDGAGRSFKANKRLDGGKALLPKPYHQRPKSSEKFRTFWRSPKCAKFRKVVSAATRELSAMLSD
jgi:hypothetical protein